MSKEPRAAASAPPDEDSTPYLHPHPHPTIRLHTTKNNTNGPVTGSTENRNNNGLDVHTQQYPSRRRSLLLSDSEISVLDLGPSLEFEVEAEEGPLRLREGKYAQRDCRGEEGKWGKGASLAVPGRQGSVDESATAGGGVAVAVGVRVISSPLLSPLRTTKKGNRGKVRGRESSAEKGGEGERL
ncbi:hypothetical protein ALT_3684 [Aspergillus lentulus]|uniref:Uncharacterized protein n=1 Tax=Aspergillus lentulus TaxID=293939 RepID=A0AAN4PHU6_ASPLE|nr:uncharacterized protein IFM58399_01957 [Aspergillus lentulus]GAQ06363.1 hypothetical protein ALT_3684 [Aspergillus lentulus]GFF28367.1 hypothetical protein IFM58399_01957 [Aspergillus lentulus]GFF49102.1 hypothetical protein IFM62136_01188 [Aspergillus lentulus]GFF66890.1 hypothetical protein IFM47457_01533 [Aspergillus lentulus]GFF67665.1 hypothetical protein IFM60648_02342 [Aspergillus lentulus]